MGGRSIVTGRNPIAAEVARRCAAYHAPYHAALQAELDRVRAIHGFAVLYDCHSIRSEIPFLFRRHLARFQHRHEFRRRLRPVGRSGRRTHLPRRRGLFDDPQRALQGGGGAAGRRATTAAPPTGCTPSRWNWRSPPTCWNARPGTTSKPPPIAPVRISSPFSKILSDWSPR